ncbi:MAG: HAD-IIB family hydrolase [Candidatus Yanofskybacteria bacterium]|nr:HAD-IIB family hydrolase [Candidatus Yanofskybacteria bacterium]
MSLQRINEKYKKVKLVIFDLDGTLTESKSDMDSEMAELLEKLLDKKLVAIIGGGKYEMFQKQLLSKLNITGDKLINLFLFPTTATSFYKYDTGDWRQVYVLSFSEEEKKKIFDAFDKVFAELNYHPEDVYQKVVEDRGSEITFSALGQNAPLDIKKEWKEEQGELKLKIAEMLQSYLPDFEVRAAGYTSIDVTRKGIDKEYGIKQIKKHLGIEFGEMLFVGDALFPGGNDYAASRTGVDCFKVKGPQDTKTLIKNLLKMF